MSDLLRVFFSGIEEFAKTMKEHSSIISESSADKGDVVQKVSQLSERVEKLLCLLEEKLGTAIEITPVKGKRMMDIKRRIHETVLKNPEGIRPPQIARLLGTKVQNLYPHLKEAVQKKTIIKDKTGTYLPPAEKAANKASKK